MFNKRQLLGCLAVVPLSVWVQPAHAGKLGDVFKSVSRALFKQADNVKQGGAAAGAAAVVAKRSSKAGALLREVGVAAATSLVADEVLAAINSTPDDSVSRWTVAYFAILGKADPDAAMAMWINPNESHFKHLAAGISTYYIHAMAEQPSPFSGCKRVYVDVSSRNKGELERRDRVLIDWMNTSEGYRVLKFTSVA